MISAVTFDLWFTLIWHDKKQYEKVIQKRLEVIRKYLHKAGINADRQYVYEIYNSTSNYRMYISVQKLLKKILDIAGARLKNEDFKKFIYDYNKATAEVIPYLNPEASDILRYLKSRKYKIGVISNTSFSSDTVAMIFDKLGIGKYFDVIVTSCDIGSMKPEKKIFYTTLSLLNEQPNKVVHVGDNYDDDVIGARDIGIHAILYRGLWDKYKDYPVTWRKYDKDPSIIIIDKLNELTKYL